MDVILQKPASTERKFPFRQGSGGDRQAGVSGGMPFRLVLHRGGVTLGADLSPGEEELIGAEVSRVFRMEKLAGSQGLPRLVTPEGIVTLSRPQQV